jgi:hypothetical protein
MEGKNAVASNFLVRYGQKRHRPRFSLEFGPTADFQMSTNHTDGGEYPINLWDMQVEKQPRIARISRIFCLDAQILAPLGHCAFALESFFSRRRLWFFLTQRRQDAESKRKRRIGPVGRKEGWQRNLRVSCFCLHLFANSSFCTKLD